MLRSLTGLVALLLVAAGMLLSVSQAQAQTTIDVDVVPDRFQISAVAPSTITVNWRISRTVDPVVASVVSSPTARITLNGATVATMGGTLSRSFPAASPQVRTATETVFIPQQLAYRAIRSGAPLVLVRTFTDAASGVADTATATLVPSGPGSEPFSISRLELLFDDQTRVKVLPKGSRLRAIAVLNTTGSGLLQATWEVALSTTTRGGAVFRPLALVRRAVGGGRRMVITSPPLPTGFEGNNIVRLRITDPAAFFEEPELQYYVTPESPLPEDVQPRLMLVTSPGPGTPLTLTTRFAWQAVPGSHLYKVEIYGAEPGAGPVEADSEVVTPVPLDPAPDTASIAGERPLTGVVVPATQTEIRLKDYTLAHLPADRRYQWTVKAVDVNGGLLGVSPPREIYKP